MSRTTTIPVEQFALWLRRHQRRSRIGTLRAGVDRDGAVVYQLTVNPPCLDAAARRRLHTWQVWPRFGVAGGIAVGTLAAALTSSNTGFLAGAVFCILGTTALAARTRPERRAVRRLRAIDFGPSSSDAQLEECARVLHLAKDLIDAEQALLDDRVDAPAHRRIWNQIYTEVSRS